MYERILIPLDGSELAESVLVSAIRVAQRLGAEVVIAQVLSPTIPASTVGVPFASPSTVEEVIEGLRENAQAYLQGVVDWVVDRGLTAGWILLEGEPAHRLLEYVRQEEVGLIAMATHGRSGIARWLMGSVAERIVHNSPIPVLLHRASAAPGQEGSGVLTPLDGSEESERILDRAVVLAKQLREPLRLLRVVPLPTEPQVQGPDVVTYVDELVTIERRQAQTYLAQLSSRLREPGVLIQTAIRVGEIAEEIVTEAEQCGARMIAMATHGRIGIDRATHGSVADQVLHTADVPVFMLRMNVPKDLGEARTAKDVMTTAVYSVTGDAPIEEALWLMVSKSVSGIPVIERDGRLVGVITEYDVLLGETGANSEERRRFAAEGPLAGLRAELAGRPVVSFMTTPVETVEENTLLDDVVRILLSKDVKRVPVTRDGVLVGIISRSDVMRVLARKLGAVQANA